MLSLDATWHRKEGSISRLALWEVSNQTPSGLIAELMEPTLLGLGHGRMRFRGIERINTPDGPAGVVQEWLVSVDDPPPPAPASDTAAGA